MIPEKMTRTRIRRATRDELAQMVWNAYLRLEQIEREFAKLVRDEMTRQAAQREKLGLPKTWRV